MAKSQQPAFGVLVLLSLASCALSRNDEDDDDDPAGAGAMAGAGPGASGGSSGQAGAANAGSGVGGSASGATGAGNGNGGSSSSSGGGTGLSAGGTGETGGGAGSTAGAETAGSGGSSAGGSDPGAGGSAGTGSTALCGDGMTETGEECDDGNDVPSDGCSDCLVESGWTCNGTSECRATKPSCWGLDDCDGYSCCESPLIAEGLFVQGYGTEEAFNHHLSPYRLDMFEVTVGRFRTFVNNYEEWRAAGNPREGAGEHPHIPGSGWDARVFVYSTVQQLKDVYMGCDGREPYGTWVADTGNDTLPVNCVDWYIATLFCIWDGGRLPTEAEWEYAAVAGDNQYLYAWGDEPALGDRANYRTDYASYDCLADGSEPQDCAATDILPVGSSRNGQALWDHYDLNGSMSEWLLDAHGHYPTLDQRDYAKLDEPLERVVRGGNWEYSPTWLTSIFRTSLLSATTDDTLGFRCARSP
ncbi:MAG TPA: SUMF1/EgtB/PvdO family nonheme iron enzyme [Polyangiaceae bacterium]